MLRRDLLVSDNVTSNPDSTVGLVIFEVESIIFEMDLSN